MTKPRDGKPSSLISPGVRQGTYLFADMTPRRTGPLGIALGGRELCGTGYSVSRTSFPYVTIEYVAQGRAGLRLEDGEVQALGPGSVFAYGPGTPHQIVAGEEELVKYFLCLSGRQAHSLIASRASLFDGPVRLARHAELRELFDWIIREGQDPSPQAAEACLKLLEVILLKLSQHLEAGDGGGSRARNRFLECKAFIEANAAGMRSLEELSGALGMDSSNLSRLFRRFQGDSPYQFLLRCRMNLAAKEFMDGRALVKEVAERLGYEDAYHFSRLFKAVHGLPPGRFRALYG
jgi:AraC-like DNA-binding protein